MPPFFPRFIFSFQSMSLQFFIAAHQVGPSSIADSWHYKDMPHHFKLYFNVPSRIFISYFLPLFFSAYNT